MFKPIKVHFCSLKIGYTCEMDQDLLHLFQNMENLCHDKISVFYKSKSEYSKKWIQCRFYRVLEIYEKINLYYKMDIYLACCKLKHKIIINNKGLYVTVAYIPLTWGERDVRCNDYTK